MWKVINWNFCINNDIITWTYFHIAGPGYQWIPHTKGQQCTWFHWWTPSSITYVFTISAHASIFLFFCFRSHLKKPTATNQATNQADPQSGSMRRDCWGQKASSWGQTPLPLDTQQQRNSHVIKLPPVTQHNRTYCTFTKAYVGLHTYSIIIKHGHPGYLGYMITDVSGCRMDGDEEAGESPWQPTSQRMAQPCGDHGVQ